jgi:hypothetical protein
MNDICVVHLVRAQNGIAPLKNFLESYKLNPGGIAHDLLILFKGFESEGELQEYRSVLEPFEYKELHVADEGFDITAYFAVPRSFDYKYYCFLNSFSIILDAEWLLKMYQYISRDEVGLVGATGSYLGFQAGDTSQWKLLIEEAIPKSKYPWLRKYWLGRLDWALRYVIKDVITWWKFRHFAFPNFHLRSNAFMGRKETIQKIVCPKIESKMDTYKCESGKQSITRQVMKSGKTVLVIGKNGQAYEKESWWKSNTFWRGNQENLLISDNQTRAYGASELKQKIYYSHCAWGANAWPDMTALQDE